MRKKNPATSLSQRKRRFAPLKRRNIVARANSISARRETSKSSKAPSTRERVADAKLNRSEQEVLWETRIQMANSREQYADLFDLAPVGYATLNQDGCIMKINQAGARLLGRSPSNLIRRPLQYFITRPDRRKLVRHLALCQQRAGDQLSTELWLNPDQLGNAACVELISRAQNQGDSDPMAYNSVLIDATRRKEAEAALQSAHDLLEHRVQERTAELLNSNRRLEAEISERKHIEQALRESEERLRLLIESSRDYTVIMLDPQGRIIPWNTGAEQLEGYPKKEIYGQHLSCLYPREDIRKGRPERLLETARKRGRAEDEGWLVRKNGSRFWANIVTTALFDEQGRMRGFSNVTRDVTERRHTQEVLRLNEKDLADFFNYSPFGLFWIGPKGQIQRVNKAGIELLGSNTADCVKHRLHEFFIHPETVTAGLKRLANHEVLKGQRAQLRRQDGKIRHVLVDANGLWEKGRMLRSRWFVRDITRRVELEREILKIAEREQHRLCRDLHDDLCQQLTGIEFLSQSLAAQLTPQSADKADRAREIARMIRQAINHTRELAHGLSPVELESHGLSGALQGLADRTRKLFKVDCRFTCGQPGVIYDAVRGIHFYRIAQEAVTNAFKHGRASRVDISLKHRNHRLQLAVKDDGIGLPARPPKRRSMGMRVMQYRAGVINGTLTFQRNPKGGTTVACSVSDPPASQPPAKL